MPVFYPSCVVNFKIRFDEAFQLSLQPDPVSIASKASGEVLPGTNVQATLEPLVLEQPIQIPMVKPDNLSIVTNRLPKTASIELPAYRQAGKFSMTLDYRDLPIDPRSIRSAGVDIHIGAVDPANFSTGMVSVEPNGTRKSILNILDVNKQPREDTLALVGYIDNWNVRHTKNGSEITIDGRDLRGILLDSPVDPKLFKNIDLTRPIDDVVKQILQRHPFGGRMQVEVSPDDWLGPGISGPLALPSPASKDGVTRVRQNADGQGLNSRPSGNVDNVNFWDLITRYCFLVGAIPYFVGQKIRIRPARSIFDQNKAGFDPSISSPFAGGKPRLSPGDNPSQFSVRRMVYGRDLEDLSFERKYSGVKARVIEVISIDTSSKKRGEQKLISVRWPNVEPKRDPITGQPTTLKVVSKVSSARATSVAPSGAATAEEVLRIPVAGISDKKKLLEIAKDIFEEIGRGEMGGSAQTKNFSSFLIPNDPNDKLAGNRDPDLLRLRPGDGVELRVDIRQLSSVSPLVSEFTNINRRSFNEQIAEVKQRLGLGNSIGDENLARAIVASNTNSVVELQKFFRVANVKFDFNKDSGISLSFDFQNYIEARSGVIQSSGANKTSVTTKVAAS